ncbi:UDP-N-acetylglucosamine--N-acetylmuramyl-(pentapeptide) pyrophosphoryl-undecaprenol N-acetylglucosamine transferase [Patescibacteria group bacterium]|nr:UDP-N-acetylglucosamine--N-acetylmuramyl-(pentapeptide) pyrophosphoryl-undecaprenol N-acetylglucosamine transferase [Patescibacteria group bacterium]
MLKIILSGGGTGGSVSPLLAVAEEIKKIEPETKFLFVGTRKGSPERKMVKPFPYIKYQSIYSGKLRRYFSFRNITDFFSIFLGFVQSLFLLRKFKPQAILSAGAFVSVPLALAAWFWRAPIFIHQQDLRPGLANKIMSIFSKKITVSFPESLNKFPASKTIFTGNPVSPQILSKAEDKENKKFNLKSGWPTLLVMGGGTGALEINQILTEILPSLVNFSQVVHLTGPKKTLWKEFSHSHYQSFDFLNQEDLAYFYQKATLVIARAGLGTLTELIFFQKPALIIPIADSHQEVNATYFAQKKAISVLEKRPLDSQLLLQRIRELIFSAEKRALLSLNISKMSQPEAAQQIAKIILKHI